MPALALSWPTPTAQRACVLCDYGRREGARCVHPAVRGQLPDVPTHDARRTHGPCGPEAEYLTIKGDTL